jgi:hypothetical protein
MEQKENSRNNTFVEKILDKFGSFIKRDLFPSSTLFLLILTTYYKESEALKSILEIFEKNTILISIVIIIILLSTTYILKMLNQALFDNFIKSNYNSILFRSETSKLKFLRKKIQIKIKQEYHEIEDIDEKLLDDFMLYQILGGKEKVSERYATDAKEIGVTFMSILIFILWVSLYVSILYILLTPLIFFIGRELVKSKYRSRAFRIYFNYLTK